MYTWERDRYDLSPADQISEAAARARASGLKNKFGLLVEEKRSDQRPHLPKLGSTLRPPNHVKIQ